MTKKLTSTKKMTSRTGFRCHAVTPSASNPKKRLVSDYTSRAIIFRDKENVIRVATAMLALADTEKMEQENTTLNLTVMIEKHNEDGYSITVNLDGKNESV